MFGIDGCWAGEIGGECPQIKQGDSEEHSQVAAKLRKQIEQGVDLNLLVNL